MKRATKLLRFTVSKITGTTPFEKHHRRKPRNLLTNVFDLEMRAVESSKTSMIWTEIIWRRTLTKQTTSLAKCLTARVHKTDIANVTRTVENTPLHFQGKLKYDTKFKRLPRDDTGKFASSVTAARTDYVPVVKPARPLKARTRNPLTNKSTPGAQKTN